MAEKDVTELVGESEPLDREVSPSRHKDPGCAIFCPDVRAQQPIERTEEKRNTACHDSAHYVETRSITNWDFA